MAKDGKRTPTDQSYRGPRPRRDKTVEKNSRLSVGECCPSGGGEDDRTGLLQNTSLRLSNLPRTGSAPTMREDLNRQEVHVVG
jgi:hypothetical protein